MGDPEDVAPKDIVAIKESGVVLALLDGLDAGTLFEIGYARSEGIPVIAVAELVREEDLTMIRGSECNVTRDLTTGIYMACWELMKNA